MRFVLSGRRGAGHGVATARGRLFQGSHDAE